MRFLTASSSATLGQYAHIHLRHVPRRSYHFLLVRFYAPALLHQARRRGKFYADSLSSRVPCQSALISEGPIADLAC